MTPDEARDTLSRMLAGAAGGTAPEWDRRLGELVRVALARSPRTNWTAKAQAGTGAQREAVGKAVDLMQAQHPYLDW